MFGYVFPRKQELLLRDWNTYKAVYCSLCHTSQKGFGAVSKIFLNFDFTFLSLIGISLEPDDPVFFEKGCTVNPLKRKVYLENNILFYTAGCQIISSRYKLLDDLHDERFLKKIPSFLILLLSHFSYKKAQRRYPEVDRFVKDRMSLNREIEKTKSSDIDTAAEPSAKALSYIMGNMAANDLQKRILERFGYLLGRYVYIADAGDDLKEDISNKRYNPFIYRYSLLSSDDDSIPKVLDEIRQLLFQTRSELALCYNLLEPYRFKNILDNIIFLGLSDITGSIGREKKKESLKDS